MNEIGPPYWLTRLNSCSPSKHYLPFIINHSSVTGEVVNKAGFLISMAGSQSGFMLSSKALFIIYDSLFIINHLPLVINHIIIFISQNQRGGYLV